MQINIHESDIPLSQLVERAVAGEEVIINRKGEPIAKIIPYKPTIKKPRRGGQWKGKVKLAPDFDELPESIMTAFRGENE